MSGTQGKMIATWVALANGKRFSEQFIHRGWQVRLAVKEIQPAKSNAPNCNIVLVKATSPLRVEM